MSRHTFRPVILGDGGLFEGTQRTSSFPVTRDLPRFPSRRETGQAPSLPTSRHNRVG
jgi:hypothetical protein